MTNKELNTHVFNWAYDQMAAQIDTELTIDVARHIEALASLLPDLAKGYQQVRLNKADLSDYLSQKGSCTPNQQKYAHNRAILFRTAHVAMVKDLQKQINSICEHMDQYGDTVYEMIDEKEAAA